MALCSRKGTFEHIPKCAGTYVRDALHWWWVSEMKGDEAWKWHEVGKPHGWPHADQKNHPGIIGSPWFTFVRHPATWLRSFWAHNGASKWVVRDHGEGHWATLCYITRPYANDDFSKFAIDICYHLPGLASWFMGTYLLPHVQVGRVEDLPQSLYDITGIWYAKPPVNVGGELPEIDPYIWNTIEASEPWLISRFYNEGLPTKFTEWEEDDRPKPKSSTRAYLAGIE